MKFLVDADVLSEATKPRPAGQVVDWLRRHDADLTVNPIILGELQYGILLLPAGRKRKRLLDWFASGIQQLNVIEIGDEMGSGLIFVAPIGWGASTSSTTTTTRRATCWRRTRITGPAGWQLWITRRTRWDRR